MLDLGSAEKGEWGETGLRISPSHRKVGPSRYDNMEPGSCICTIEVTDGLYLMHFSLFCPNRKNHIF